MDQGAQRVKDIFRPGPSQLFCNRVVRLQIRLPTVENLTVISLHSHDLLMPKIFLTSERLTLTVYLTKRR